MTKAEFVRAIPKLGIEAETFEIEQLFGFFDPDNDGSIELKELSKKLKGPSAAFGRDLARELEQVEAALRTADASEARVRKAWDAYDVDASDSIDLGEVMSLMDDLGLLKTLTSDPVDFATEMFIKYDANDDGVLSFNEFRSFFNAARDDANGRRKAAATATARTQHGLDANQREARKAIAEKKAREKAAAADALRKQNAAMRERIARAAEAAGGSVEDAEAEYQEARRTQMKSQKGKK